MTLRFERRPKIAVVVDLAVEGEPDAFVLVRHGFTAAGAIDDGQPPMTEGRHAVVEEAVAVRPAVGDRVGHPPNGCRRTGPKARARVEREDAGDATHRQFTERYAAAYSRTMRSRVKRL